MGFEELIIKFYDRKLINELLIKAVQVNDELIICEFTNQIEEY